MTDECDMCGAGDGSVETIGFTEREGEDWRVGRVCRGCRRRWLMPTLRHLFDKVGAPSDGRPTPWLNEPEDPSFEAPGHPGFPIRVFETESGTVHAVDAVYTGPTHGWNEFCVAECGVAARADTEHYAAAYAGDDYCRRCAEKAPSSFQQHGFGENNLSGSGPHDE